MRSKHDSSPSRRRRLHHVGEGAVARAHAAAPLRREMICTGMCRVAGSSLRLFNTVQPSMSGRNMSSVMAVGRYCRASAAPACPRVRDHALESLVARQPEQHARVMRIVLDDEQHAVARRRCRRDRRRSLLRCATRQHGMRRTSAAPASPEPSTARRGPGVHQRQIQGERAALARACWSVGFRRPAASRVRG